VVQIAAQAGKLDGQLEDEVGTPFVLNKIFAVCEPVKWPLPLALSTPTPFIGASESPVSVPPPPLLVPSKVTE
jgi:hypothetical protein